MMISKIIVSSSRRLHMPLFRGSRFMSGSLGLNTGTIAVPIIAALTFNYLSPTHCDQEYVEVEQLIQLPKVFPTALSTHEEANKGFLQSMLEAAKQGTYGFFYSMYKLARYTERWMTYTVYGLPMLGLLPLHYTLGGIFPNLEEYTWRYLIWAVGRLGPCFVKFAQWASTRPDLFPPALVDHLVRLQDDVPAHYPIEMTYNTLRIAFGEHWRERLELDGSKPLGAGSVAQVFRGQLKTEGGGWQEVAVKLIHPHVEKLVEIDMELLRMFANFIDRFPSLEILSLGETLRQFSEVMHRQLDLTVEATNLDYFNKKFEHDSWAVFPKPVKGFVTKNVLVETLMAGKPIAHFMNMAANAGDATYQLKMKLSDLGCRLVLKMVFFDNFVHGDLHPGNVLVRFREDGEPQLVVLDCGIVYFSRTEQEFDNLVNICLAFMKHDGREAARHMIANNPENSVQRAEGFMDSIQGLVDRSEQHSYFEHISEYVAEICELSRVHLVRLDPSYFKVAMALKVAEGISLALNRDLDLVSKCIPIVLQTQSLRRMGVSKFPSPEEDDQRLVNVQPHDTPDHPDYGSQQSQDKRAVNARQQKKL